MKRMMWIADIANDMANQTNQLTGSFKRYKAKKVGEEQLLPSGQPRITIAGRSRRGKGSNSESR
jgi:hypothetical protein